LRSAARIAAGVAARIAACITARIAAFARRGSLNCHWILFTNNSWNTAGNRVWNFGADASCASHALHFRDLTANRVRHFLSSPSFANPLGRANWNLLGAGFANPTSRAAVDNALFLFANPIGHTAVNHATSRFANPTSPAAVDFLGAWFAYPIGHAVIDDA
jgi:hypothetical protein